MAAACAKIPPICVMRENRQKPPEAEPMKSGKFPIVRHENSSLRSVDVLKPSRRSPDFPRIFPRFSQENEINILYGRVSTRLPYTKYDVYKILSLLSNFHQMTAYKTFKASLTHRRISPHQAHENHSKAVWMSSRGIFYGLPPEAGRRKSSCLISFTFRQFFQHHPTLSNIFQHGQIPEKP